MESKTELAVHDKEAISSALRNLHSSENPTNWVLIGYKDGSKNTVELKGSGTGGITELKNAVSDDAVQYAMVELTVEGDEYNSVKFVLVTYLGPNVSAGLMKARASGHRDELMNFVKDSIAINSQVQCENRDEINYDNLAQALTRFRAKYATSKEATKERQMKSRSAATGGALSKLNIIQEDEAKEALRTIFSGKNDWAILAYVKGSKDEVELVKTGTGGPEGLALEWPKDRIYYSVLRYVTKADAAVAKFALVTMIGDEVSPIQKARSAGQRKDISDFILTECPYGGQFQPSDKSELNTEEIAKFFKDV